MKSPLLLSTAVWIAIVSSVFSSQAVADVVYLTDGSVLYGRIESIEQNGLVFQVRIPGTNSIDSVRYRTRQIPQSEILTSVRTVKEERLTLLNPANPEGYRDLADTLAVQKRDPEARDLAIRLYLLAAFHGKQIVEDTFITHCFDQLISLARNYDEEKRFRALAQIETPGSRNWLIIKSETNGIDNSNERSSSNESPDAVEQRRQLLHAVQMIRRGIAEQASTIINQPWAKEAMKPFDSTCDWFELREMLASRELDVKQLARLVELEVMLSQRDLQLDKYNSSEDWSRIIPESNSLRSLEDSKISSDFPVQFDNVSEFDLSKSIYRAGQWIVPASDVQR